MIPQAYSRITNGIELLDMNGWEAVGTRYQKTVTNRSGREVWVMLWFDARRQIWLTGEVHGNSYASVKSFHSLELALQT